MMKCPVCQRETSPVKIGGKIYCNVCGTPAAADDQAKQPVPRRLSLDLTPRSHAQVASRATPAAPQKPVHHAAASNELHRRVKTSQVLDLRNAKPKTIEGPKISAAPHHDPAAPPKSTTHERHEAHLQSRLEQAKQVERSSSIQKFTGQRLATPSPQSHHQTVSLTGHQPAEPTQELPQLAATHHEAMTRLTPVLPPESSPRKHPTSAHWRPHLGLNRTATTVVAIAIMVGYIWLENYPKLALQSANSKAGIAASMPSYLPSSYTLHATDTSPGLVTLNFTSPSTSQALKINQHRTSWDSSSLLDNFVAKQTDDYATVQGQGLTIYLFNNNQAAWVNHGIWYSIAGADRLSREQILKIAYSL